MTDIDKSSESSNLFKALELAKKHSGKNTKLVVNSLILHYERIVKLFEIIQIPFETFPQFEDNSSPFETFPQDVDEFIKYCIERPFRFDINFDTHSDFQDLYIIVAILKDFGLHTVSYSHKNNNEVLIGLYYTIAFPNKKVYPKGITTDEFLKLPFSLTTDELIQSYFNEKNNDNIESSTDNSINENEEFEISLDDLEEDYEDRYYRNEHYGEYSGTYAQDVEGLSDDFIKDALDGFPEAYWNID